MSDEAITVDSAISQIIASNECIRKFWTEEASGWSLKATAELLENARIDRLVSIAQPAPLDGAVRRGRTRRSSDHGLGQSRNPRGRHDDVVPLRLRGRLREAADEDEDRLGLAPQSAAIRGDLPFLQRARLDRLAAEGMEWLAAVLRSESLNAEVVTTTNPAKVQTALCSDRNRMEPI